MLAPPPPDLSRPDRLVGITTTVPVEIILAAGLVPLDLNNVFISDPDPAALVAAAEREGFPRTTCCWVKGIFAAARRAGVSRLVGVVQGDCSNTHGLLESFQFVGGTTLPFAYPYDRDPDALDAELRRFAGRLGTTLETAEAVRRDLAPLRAKLAELDRLSWQDRKLSALENHLWLVAASDFCGDPERFERALDAFLGEARARPPLPPGPRVAYVGVPPICPRLYRFLDMLGLRVVLNETQHQFSMPHPADSLVEQYRAYTYPYGIFARIEDIEREIRRRRADAVLHYVQSFCYRQIEDHILRRSIPLRTLTLEFDRPGPLDGQTRTRIEAFAETLPPHTQETGK
jgi:benzoyl-CoA reductase/2-hydroxyglutaryl-CoA dehydratase subunit BcrC/BadD/HgdB